MKEKDIELHIMIVMFQMDIMWLDVDKIVLFLIN